MNEELSETRKTISFSIAQVIVILVVAVGIMAGSVILFTHGFGNGLNTNDDQKVIEQVSKVMDLPSDETPSIATVLDKTKLSDQAFFARAEDGDKLLLYTGAQKAILYRPSSKTIIEVMPLIISQDTQSDNSQN